ncbi:unnamed protein product [Haemonchus placei]|uniref:Uncharacterized protein n=1 Tax=Haemonchus placei TaxID=6290 RepID=A0A0N4VRW3_HAEPC|nr:unnamed protein product [Haemonchus placei]
MLYVQPPLKHGRIWTKTISLPPSTRFLGDFQPVFAQREAISRSRLFL